jgi:putative pre-16S rRNA nuclease
VSGEADEREPASGAHELPIPSSTEGSRVPLAGRLLGVDYGSVRIGLAVSDRERRIASPLATYTCRSPELDAAHFRSVAVSEEIAAIVLGLPVHTDGREGVKAKEAREFGKWLARVTGLMVIFRDERFTTVEAEQALWSAGLTHKQRKARRDRVAAQMLLQGYLDAGSPGDEPLRGLDEPPTPKAITEPECTES